VSLAEAQRRKGERKEGERNRILGFGEAYPTGSAPMHENEISRLVVDAAYQVHVKLGPGLLESVYETILKFELERRGLRVQRQEPVTVVYEGIRFDEGFRADLIVESKVLIELKSVEEIAPVHKKQVLTYLKLTGIRLGLLINFGAPRIKDGITRIVNGLDD
jgi:GxxExxY protein